MNIEVTEDKWKLGNQWTVYIYDPDLLNIDPLQILTS